MGYTWEDETEMMTPEPEDLPFVPYCRKGRNHAADGLNACVMKSGKFFGLSLVFSGLSQILRKVILFFTDGGMNMTALAMAGCPGFKRSGSA